MRIEIMVLFLSVCASIAWADSETPPIVLDGQSLSIKQLLSIARSGTPVKIAQEAEQKVTDAFNVLVEAANQGMPIYGVNRGVGLNKDKTIFSGSILSPQAIQQSQQFNANNLRATAAALGPTVAPDVARATLAIRLNTLLTGHSGARPEVAQMYADFLNKGITPIMPSIGSVGEADISVLSHIGLNMMGEGEVFYEGSRMPAANALKLANLKPLMPMARDSLAIMSSNAYSAAIAATALDRTESIAHRAHEVMALSLEGLNGNMSPFSSVGSRARGYWAPSQSASELRDLLSGSYLNQPSATRHLQDPLSFRTANQQFGALYESLSQAKEFLTIQMNNSDDNPGIFVGTKLPANAPAEEASHFVKSARGPSGWLIPTNGFDPTQWTQKLQAVKESLNAVSEASAQRITQLDSDSATGLTRFLSPNEKTLGFSAIQKAYSDLAERNRTLAAPHSISNISIAGGIEDMSTSAPEIGQELLQMGDNTQNILGIELMHAAQAVDLRLKSDPTLKLGAGTQQLYTGFREQVPFLSEDRSMSSDIWAADLFLGRRGYPTKAAVPPAAVTASPPPVKATETPPANHPPKSPLAALPKVIDPECLEKALATIAK